MLPAATKQGGQCFAFPDVCKTPAAPSPVPIPYPNIAMVANTDNAIEEVLMVNKATVVENSKNPNLVRRRARHGRRRRFEHQPQPGHLQEVLVEGLRQGEGRRLPHGGHPAQR